MNTYSQEDREVLLNIARLSINEGLKNNRPLNIGAVEYNENLQQQRASFVTLENAGALRGCIGSLQAYRALARDVAENAFAAAFKDPRFPALKEDEYKRISIHISVLSQPEAIIFKSEKNLLQQIRPGIDGLILTDVGHCGTFLPSVWEQLPTVEMFLMHLKNKAGLASNYWSDTIQVERYTTEMIE